HLDFHGTMERDIEAKARLLLGEERPPAAINVGDEWGDRLAAERPDAVTFGTAQGAQVGPDALAGIDLKLRGRFNVGNALGALAAARMLGLDDAAIAHGLESVARALEAAREGDVVAIAGKGHEQGQELAGRTIPFDDREVARETLRRLGAAA